MADVIDDREFEPDSFFGEPMNDSAWEKVRHIFETRGVSREVAEARPYVPFEKRAEWVKADDGPFGMIPRRQRSATSIQDVNRAAGFPTSLKPKSYQIAALEYVSTLTVAPLAPGATTQNPMTIKVT